MAQIRKKITSLLTSLCSVMLSFLGFSCSSQEKELPVMYGCAMGDFEIKGAVTTTEGKTVENAEVRVTYPDESSGLFSIDTKKTDKEGNYYIMGGSISPTDELKVVCIPDDPTLEADSVNVKMNYRGGEGWYRGKAEATVNLKLKTKQQPDTVD